MRKAETSLGSMLASGRTVVAMGGHDGLSAKLAEEAGFDAVWASGLEISTSAGVPDANILTMTEFLRAAREMNEATRLPIIADCDTGFGNSNNVIHMVRQYEASGVAAVCIEDKLFPKVNSFVPGRQELAPAWEFAGKIMAAKKSQRTEEFVVIARLEALIAGSTVDEALRRAEIYQRAGADMLLIHSKAKTPDIILEFLRRWDRQCPIAVVPTTFPQLTVSDWQAAGVNLVIFANHGMRAAITAMQETYAKIIAAGTTLPVENEIAPMSKVFELQGMPAMKLDEERFLNNSAGSDVRAIILAGGSLAPGDLQDKLGGPIELPLLDIYGRTVLQRQHDTLTQAGVRATTLVSQIPPETVAQNGPIEAVKSQGRGLLETIMVGLDHQPWKERNLLCFSDILFEPNLLETLFQEVDDIVLLVDRTFREAKPRKASLDLVMTKPAPPSELRALNRQELYTVEEISKSLDLEHAHFEFVGLTLLSAKGTRIFRELYAKFESREAERAATASLNTFLSFLISSGVKISAREVRRGWLEIHDFQDYKTAVEQVRAR